MDIRRFAIVVIDDFDNEIDRFNLDYADTPKNLGFEMEFTTLESKLTTQFTSAREKHVPITLNINFLPPQAYAKANAFKRFIQSHMNQRTVFEYSDTTEVKNWEGKIQKFSQEELTDWGGLVCPISFLPATPKYLRRDNTILIKQSSVGKTYPFKYPYAYGKSVIQNNLIENTYFDEIPLRVTVYGVMTDPQIGLFESVNGVDTVYTSVRFNLTLAENEHLVIDAVRSKILLWKNEKYVSAYDYVDKDISLDAFLFAKANTVSRVAVVLNSGESGYLTASYRQYIL